MRRAVIDIASLISEEGDIREWRGAVVCSRRREWAAVCDKLVQNDFRCDLTASVVWSMACCHLKPKWERSQPDALDVGPRPEGHMAVYVDVKLHSVVENS
jgi:hypothetical protein